MWDSAIAGGPGPIPTPLLFTIGRKSGKESIMPLIYGEIESEIGHNRIERRILAIQAGIIIS